MSEHLPLVSVIIPTYKRGSLIAETLDSVIAQTYPYYELIIVDDASPDNTADWIEEHYPRFQLIRLTRNLGNGGARNAGLQHARGEYIAFLDHDDRWEPDYLETQIKTFQAHPDAVLCYCDYWEIEENKNPVFKNLKPKEIYADFTYYLLRWNIIDSLSLSVISKEALGKTGPFNESLRICNDMELYLRLSTLGRIVHIPRPLVYKSIHSQNLSKNYRLWAKDELALHEIFFATEASKPYHHLKSEIQSYSLLKILRITWPFHHDIGFALSILCQSFFLAPHYRITLLFNRLRKKFYRS
jgi:glycosyltransferase involved in cell wall biosynthesis